MKTKDVILKINSVQHDISDEITTNEYRGKYSFVNGTHVISYEEFYDVEEGKPAKSNTLLKITDSDIHIIKKGAISSKMHFSKGNSHSDVYETPFGVFDMKLDTTHMAVSFSDSLKDETFENSVTSKVSDNPSHNEMSKNNIVSENSIRNDVSKEHLVHAEIKYNLNLNNAPVSKCSIQISVYEVNS